MPLITGFHHISAFTKSKEQNVHFYTQVLGMRLVKQTLHQENWEIPHLFYGDYSGAPGTLLTFFVYPKIGRSYLNNHYFSSITLSVPFGSLPFWQNRLTDFAIDYSTNHQHQLTFSDPDGLELRLAETSDTLSGESSTKHSSVPGKHQISGIHTVEILVENTELEETFYTEWLGLTNFPSLTLDSSERLEILPSNTDERTRFGKGTIDHIALSVDSPDDLTAFKERAVKLGYTVEKLTDRHYFKSLYVKSPAGLRIELATKSPGFTIDEPLETLGTTITTLKLKQNYFRRNTK